MLKASPLYHQMCPWVDEKSFGTDILFMFAADPSLNNFCTLFNGKGWPTVLCARLYQYVRAKVTASKDLVRRKRRRRKPNALLSGGSSPSSGPHTPIPIARAEWVHLLSRSSPKVVKAPTITLEANGSLLVPGFGTTHANAVFLRMLERDNFERFCEGQGWLPRMTQAGRSVGRCTYSDCTHMHSHI